MIELAPNSARVTDREITRRGRLKAFDVPTWLRGHRFAEDSAFSLAEATVVRTHPRADFVFEPPKLVSPKVENFISEQSFEGVVLSIDLDDKTFWARLADLSAAFPDEEAEFSMDEIPVDDWSLIVPGALFSWNIGREWRDSQVRRVSDIRFRRFFKFTKVAIARAEERADALASLISESNTYPAEDTAEARRA